MKEIKRIFRDIFGKVEGIDERINLLNSVRAELAKYSPFQNEPVDCVAWVKKDLVHANDYNPNSVAPPEMKLLETSIEADGYTQPIVAWKVKDKFEVVDGFHRNRVGKECPQITERVHGYLPVVSVHATNRDARIASTIRHNRARGKHKIEAMSDIVVELKRRNWSDEKISKNLGMDQDEILRLCQITGLSDLFLDQDFSKAWDIEGDITEADFVELTDDVESYEEDISNTRVVNTNDDGRIFHTFEKWECHKAGFYNTTMPNMTKAQCERAYADFLSDLPRFGKALQGVITEWKHSCEHYLTNVAMNRIAWLGQASVCYDIGIPSTFRGGYSLLTKTQQNAADELALVYLNKWLVTNDLEEVDMEQALSHGRQSDIY